MINHLGPQRIETERLIIRPWTKEDAPSAFKNWAADPLVQVPLAEPVYENQEAVEALIERYMAAFETEGKYRWAVELKQTGECIGLIAFFFLNPVNEHGEIEYGLGREYWGKGLITEAAKAVIKFGFETLKLHRIQVSYKEYNKASFRVIQKCGFTYEGVYREYYKEGAGYVSRIFYSMLSHEYEESKAQGLM